MVCDRRHNRLSNAYWESGNTDGSITAAGSWHLEQAEVDRLEREIRDIETEKDQDRAKVSAKGQIGRGLEGKKKVSIRDRAMGAAERSGAMVTARVAKRMKPEASKKSTRR